MVRLREIKLYGNSNVIFLTKTDMEDMKWKIGDKVDIELLKKKVKRNANK